MDDTTNEQTPEPTIADTFRELYTLLHTLEAMVQSLHTPDTTLADRLRQQAATYRDEHGESLGATAKRMGRDDGLSL